MAFCRAPRWLGAPCTAGGGGEQQIGDKSSVWYVWCTWLSVMNRRVTHIPVTLSAEQLGGWLQAML